MTSTQKRRVTSSVLIVDDEADILSVIERYFENKRSSGRMNRFIVKGFTDPIVALSYFKEHSKQIDIVISDIRMPTMTGFQFIRQIKTIYPEVKVFLMTSFEINKSEFDKVLPSVKVDGLLQKPISSMKTLTEIFECAINNSSTDSISTSVRNRSS